jgi:enoyl-CoA hydratase/carnithine racemase
VTGVRTELRGEVGLVELAEPESRNALSAAVRAGLLGALAQLERGGAAAVVITGQGSAFCAGGDLKAMPADADTGLAFITEILAFFAAVRDCPVPTIAAVNGPAMGGGAELVLACDLAVAAERASFGFPETGIGMVAPFAAMTLPALVPRPLAKELALTGRILAAEEAARLGLVNQVCPDDRLLDTALALAQVVAERSLLANSITKAIQNGVAATPDAVARLNSAVFADADTKHRIQQFLSRRRASRPAEGAAP